MDRRLDARKKRIWQTGWGGLIIWSLLLVPMPNLMGVSLAAIAQEAPAAVVQAYTLLRQGLTDQAIAAFQRAIEQYPQSLDARLGLAIAYRRAGRDADTLAAYEQVLAIDPNNRLALRTMGILGGYRTEWQERGIAALTTLLALEPNDAEARAQRALLYGYQGRFSEAIADYNVVLQSNPSPEALVGAAQVYAYSGDYGRALELFGRYRSSGGSIRGDAVTPYALALRETGNAAQAIQVLEAQLRQQRGSDTTTLQMRSALAIAYAANGQINQAAAALTPLRGRQDARILLARALNEIGRYSGNAGFTEEAIALYQQILTQTPDLTVGLAREIADVLSGYPQSQGVALEVYRQLAQQQPGDLGLQVQQAVLERELGLISSADLRQRLQVTLPVLPTDPAQLQTIAQGLTRLDPPSPELLPLYQALINAGANEPFLNFRLAQIFIQRNELGAARNALAAYATTPEGMQDQFANLLLLADIDRREGNLDASAQRYLTILTSNPTDSGVVSGALQGLAGIRQSQGRLGEAIALYDQIIARNPQDWSKQLGRASLAYQAGMISVADAEAVLNTWLATRPLTDTPAELFSLAGALPPNPQREGLYVALLQVEPNNVSIQLRLAQVLAVRDPALAQAQIARLIALDPNNLGAYFVQGQLSQELGDLNQASRAYEEILRRQPTNADALVALGGTRFQQRQFQAAAQLYSAALALEPTNQIAQTSLISLTAVQGRRLEALQQLQQLQLQLSTAGVPVDPAILQQMQRIREEFLQQRGFQPPWERY